MKPFNSPSPRDVHCMLVFFHCKLQLRYLLGLSSTIAARLYHVSSTVCGTSSVSLVLPMTSKVFSLPSRKTIRAARFPCLRQRSMILGLICAKSLMCLQATALSGAAHRYQCSQSRSISPSEQKKKQEARLSVEHARIRTREQRVRCPRWGHLISPMFTSWWNNDYCNICKYIANKVRRDISNNMIYRRRSTESRLWALHERKGSEPQCAQH